MFTILLYHTFHIIKRAFDNFFAQVFSLALCGIHIVSHILCESYLTVTFDRKDGKKDVMEIYKDSSRRSVVKLNGETSFRIQSTWVDTFVANMDRLLKGEAVDDNY